MLHLYLLQYVNSINATSVLLAICKFNYAASIVVVVVDSVY